MARRQSDREDLLREATALVQRVEIRLDDDTPNIVVGFRRDHSCSLFFGPDLVFQFDQLRRLRRGYHDGRLIKAESGKLVALRRQRTKRESTLLRQPLTEQQTEAYLALLNEQARRLAAAMREGRATLLGQVPPDGDVWSRVENWLGELPETPEVADRAGLAR